ncbi:MAG: glycosyltransferase [Candidatus Moranbacteria bacterium]|nr:glycosyltransferase [Candidatus Moranbacteria bacterium]
MLQSNNQKFNPLVSIIIPVFNGANYLREAIESVSAQTYVNIETIIVNDGSTDDTEKIAKSYGDKIRYFAKENGGVSSALNLALKEMKGEYFSWLSHDDLFLPNRLEKQIEILATLKDRNVILYSDFEFIDENARKIKTMRLDHKMLMSKPEYALFHGHINGNTLLIPKKAFDQYGFFDEKLKCTQDYAKWFEMMKTYKFIHLPAVLAKYRVHKSQASSISPKVVVEGNALWIKMMQELPMETKRRLEGNEANFYKKMVFFLKQTPYTEAMKFANKKANENRLKNNKSEIDYSKAWHISDNNEIKSKLQFMLFSPIKFLKKYLG